MNLNSSVGTIGIVSGVIIMAGVLLRWMRMEFKSGGSGVTAVLTVPVVKQCQDPSLAEFASFPSSSMV